MAVLLLAVAIGFNTALFSIVDAVLLRPLPVERADRLAAVYTKGGDGDKYATSSYPDYIDFRARNTVFTDVLAFSPAIAAVKAGDRSRLALGEVVSGNYFQLLGVKAAIGRTLLPDDDRPGAPRAVMISHRLWRRDYGADPAITGRTIMRQGLGLAATGVAIGLALSWLAARAIASALYGVGAVDPAAWSTAVCVLLGAAALANYLPARRAARVDPSVALRTA